MKKSKWVQEHSSFDFYETLNKIRNDWKYPGLLAAEPEGRIDRSLFRSFLQAMHSLKK